jgi:hypothetical protein
MERISRRKITAPCHPRTDGAGADFVHQISWIENKERGAPPSSRSFHPGKFPSTEGNFASKPQRREFHTLLNNSMEEETE